MNQQDNEMDGQDNGTNRAFAELGSGAGASHDHEGQLILTSHEMQSRLGQKFCTETELLPLMFAHGLVRRARNIQTAVIPLDGDSIFKVVHDSSNPIVGAAKLAIFRMRGALEDFSMLLENPEAQPIGKVHECEFGVPFDENGAIYFISTDSKTKAYNNAHHHKLVKANMWPIRDGEAARFSDVRRVVQNKHDGRTINQTKNQPGSWMSIDLGAPRSLVPNYYCLRHGYGNRLLRMQSWDFEASNDGAQWTVLMVHKDDTVRFCVQCSLKKARKELLNLYTA
jgi:hypothetical protein